MIKFLYYYFTTGYSCDFTSLLDDNKLPVGTVNYQWLENNSVRDKFVVYEDNRLPAVSVQQEANTYSEIELVYNYSITYAMVMWQNEMIKMYMDFGLIPLCFYPTSHKEFIDYVDEKLTLINIHHYKLPSVYNHNKKDVQLQMFDSWVSRISVADLLHCQPETVKMTQSYREVMNYDPS